MRNIATAWEARGVDVGRYNAGQKGYFWFAGILGVVLLVSGIPLWYPWLLDPGWRRAARLVHHAAFLLMVGGFILHGYLSAVMFPGTMSGMMSRILRGIAGDRSNWRSLLLRSRVFFAAIVTINLSMTTINPLLRMTRPTNWIAFGAY